MGLFFYKVACSRCGLPSNNKREMVKDKGKVVPVLKEFKHYAMKVYGGVDV
jgi:hypothetical protein